MHANDVIRHSNAKPNLAGVGSHQKSSPFRNVFYFKNPSPVFSTFDGVLSS